MHVTHTDRGVSTVIDVTLALLFISAAVLVLATYLDSDDAVTEPELADHTAETIAGTTVSIDYSVADSDAVVDGEFSNDSLTRVAYGPAAGMLADAALTNVRFDGEEMTDSGDSFEAAVEGAILETLTGADTRFDAVATWKPHEESSIEGEATAGRTPPPSADVSSVSMTVPSGIDTVDRRAAFAYMEIREWNAAETYDEGDRVHHEGVAYEAQRETSGVSVEMVHDWEALGAYDPDIDGVEGSTHVIAEAIVNGYLPPHESQLALEGGGIEGALTVDRYERLANAVGGVDFGDALEPATADAATSNALLIDALATEIVAFDLDGALGDELDEIERVYPESERYEPIEEAFAESVSTGEVTITVRVWNP